LLGTVEGWQASSRVLVFLLDAALADLLLDLEFTAGGSLLLLQHSYLAVACQLIRLFAKLLGLLFIFFLALPQVLKVFLLVLVQLGAVLCVHH